MFHGGGKSYTKFSRRSYKMNNDKLKQFLDGELDFDELQKTRNNSDFVGSYKKVIEHSKKQTPDFNPFEKIKSNKKKRMVVVKRFLPYAALIILIFCIYIFYQSNQTSINNITATEIEIEQLKENTERALLCFSKDLNTCLKKVSKSKELYEENSKKVSMKKIEIEFNNPLKNLKIN